MITRQEKVCSPKGEITIITIENRHGARVRLSSLGAGIISIEVPDREGRLADVVLGYSDTLDYIYDGPNAGKTAGRFANRIAAGKLRVDGKDYQLAVNCGPNHLHGGPEGFQNQIWDVEIVGDDSVVFSRVSPDGEENYPGNLDVKVAYRWDDDNRLSIGFEAVTDSPTVVNLTNHAYFHLGGHSKGDALKHTLKLNSSKYLVTDDTLVPTGELGDVVGTPMDFTEALPLGLRINDDFHPLKVGKGYDHCWAVDGWREGRKQLVATLVDDESGRRMQVFSDQPAMQVYTGNWLSGSPLGKDGVDYHDYDCVAIECQGYPDAPNCPEFPSQFLAPGEIYRRMIEYLFDTK